MRIKEQTSYKNLFTRGWITSSIAINYSTLNIEHNEHNRKELRIQSRNQQAHTSNIHKVNMGRFTFVSDLCWWLIIDLLMQHNNLKMERSRSNFPFVIRGTPTMCIAPNVFWSALRFGQDVAFFQPIIVDETRPWAITFGNSFER